MLLPSLKELSNEELLSRVKILRGEECLAIARMVLHLFEIDSRQLYREAGHSSLFNYCRALGYSEAGAQRRIVAARCIRENPEIYEMLHEGRISLSAVSEMAKVIEPENKAEVIPLFEGASKREAERLSAKFGAPRKPRREVIRAKRVVIVPPVPEAELEIPPAEVQERFDLNLEVDPEFMELLDEARRYGEPAKISEVLKRTLAEYVQKRRPKPVKSEEVRKTGSSPGESRQAKSSRYIPKAMRNEVRLRDGGRCCYVAPDGTRCLERSRLQFDHIHPYALGGRTEPGNIRLMCQAHNLLAAEQIFGRTIIVTARNKKCLTSSG